MVVTDIRMPPTSTDEGIRVAALLREQHPGIGVVVLSNYAEPAYALALLESGSRAAPTCSRSASTIAPSSSRRSRRSPPAAVLDSKIVEPLVAAKLRVERSPWPSSPDASARSSPRSPRARATPRSPTRRPDQRAVEKHINSIFLKLDLAYSEDVSKRVKATLLFLADADGARAA